MNLPLDLERESYDLFLTIGGVNKMVKGRQSTDA